MTCPDCDCLTTEDWEAMQNRVDALEETVMDLIEVLVEMGVVEIDDEE